jgi:glycosyltransferase involved in cell wall biosynthesis
MAKKVLIITYYWPPGGGIAVLRCLKFAKYLREFGWEPVVYTAENAHYPFIDHSNDKDVPSDITILKHRIWEPYHIYKWLTGKKKDANVNNVFYVQEDNKKFFHRLSVWVRSNFFIPDARALWIRPSVRYLTQYLKEHPVDAILSSGPPHTNNRIANLVHRKTGIPWLADFQDPWTQIDYYALLKLTPWGDRRHRKMEQQLFRDAGKISIVSPSWKEDLEAIGASNVEVIPLGYDREDFDRLERKVEPGFSITHLGMMGYDRNPEGLFKALVALLEEIPGFSEDLSLVFYGPVDPTVLKTMEEQGLSSYVQMKGNVSREEALQATCNSPILLLLLNQQPNGRGRIPGKIFEYLYARRPILVLQPEPSDAGHIVETSESGFAVMYDEVERMQSILREWYAQYRYGKLAQPLDNTIEQYSVRRLAGQVAEYLDEL